MSQLKSTPESQESMTPAPLTPFFRTRLHAKSTCTTTVGGTTHALLPLQGQYDAPLDERLVVAT
jgi:hypothetical protein